MSECDGLSSSVRGTEPTLLPPSQPTYQSQSIQAPNVITEIKKLWEFKQSELKKQCELLYEHQEQYLKLTEKSKRNEEEILERLYQKELLEIHREFEEIKEQIKTRLYKELQRKKKYVAESDASDSGEKNQIQSLSFRPPRKLRKNRSSNQNAPFDSFMSNEDESSLFLGNGKNLPNRKLSNNLTLCQSLKDYEIESDLKTFSAFIFTTDAL